MQRFAFSLLLCFLAIWLTGCARNGLRPHPDYVSLVAQTQIPTLAQRAIDTGGVQGLSIAVALDGTIVYSEGFGFADADHTVPATADTVYDIASVGKHFTAAAVLQLAERGQLRLSQSARDWVPALPGHFPDATIEQLLRHTSGFVGGELDELAPPPEYSLPRYGTDLLTDVGLQTGRSEFEPGETWVYCNAGYLVLGLIVEAASGMRYDDYMRQHVLGPIGAHRMYVCETPPQSIGTQQLRLTDGDVSPVPFIHMSAYGGQGSIASSAVDLLRWSRALNKGEIISARSLKQMRSPSELRGSHATVEVPYGMAQRIGQVSRYRKVGHTGTLDGGSAALAYYPDAGLEIAVISNTNGRGVPHAHTIETAIAKRLLDVHDPQVGAMRVPVSDEQRNAIVGTYTGEEELVAWIYLDELVATKGDQTVARLVHIGDMRFRSISNPDHFEWFLMDGERAGWWVYSLSGNYISVLRRVGP